MSKRGRASWIALALALVTAMLLSTAALAQEPVRLQVGLRGDPAVWWELVKDFHAKHPDIVIEHIEQVDWQMEKIILREVAGDPFDVVYTVIEQAWSLVAEGIIYPLDEMMARDTSEEWLEFVEDVHPALWRMWQRDGKQYYIPYEWNNMVMYYNPKLFDEAGLSYPKPGWTWDEFLLNARTLQRWEGDQKTVDGYACTINSPFGFGPWIYTAGGSILDPTWTESRMNDSRVIEAVRFVRSLFLDYEVAEVFCPRIPETGFVGMWGAGRWVLYWYDLNNFHDYDIVTWPVHPVFGQEGTSLGGGGHAISAKSTKKEAAWEFIKWLNSPEIIDYWTRIGDSNPSRASIAMSDAVLGKPKNAVLYYQALDHAVPVPAPPQYMEIDAAFNQELIAIWNGEISPEEGVARIHERIQVALGRQ